MAQSSGSATPLRNTNVWSTRQLVVMALMCAISVLLTFVEVPLFPAAPWLKYDPSFVPAMVCGFAFGAGPGLAVGIVAIALHCLMDGNVWGNLMNVIVILGYVIPSAMIYRRIHTIGGAVVGLVVSFAAALILAIVGNLLITPIYAGVDVDAVMAMIVPILLPFNAIKAGLNAVFTLVVYKSISNLITPKKDQVKGL